MDFRLYDMVWHGLCCKREGIFKNIILLNREEKICVEKKFDG